jgi:hypothetical protein
MALQRLVPDQFLGSIKPAASITDPNTIGRLGLEQIPLRPQLVPKLGADDPFAERSP